MIDRLFGIAPGETIGSVLARHRGVGPGFDLLRIVLALYIFYGHTLWIAGGATSVAGVAALGTHIAGGGAVIPTGFTGWTRPFHVAAVPVFFALSGFLVIGSAIRLRATATFLAYRFLRIFPALVVETMLCAFILGALLTSHPIRQYFSDPLFLRYLGNMAGFISFKLPGLFAGNPVAGVVNANLWTLPAEFDCYFITALLMGSRIIYNRNLYTLIYSAIGSFLLIASLSFGYQVTPGILSPVAITFYFFTGVLFYHWREYIPVHWTLFIVATAASYMLLMSTLSVFVAPIFVTYCMTYVGMVAVPKIPLVSRGDYSYGIYLYGFPIAQALVARFPGVFIGHRYLLLAAATLATCAWAAFSWHLIELHALKLKRHLPPRFFPKPAKVQVQQSPSTRLAQAG